MKTALVFALFAVLACGQAYAGRNAGGAMIVHTNDNYQYSHAQVCNALEGQPPQECEDADTECGNAQGQVVWLLASFAQHSSPGVTVVYFGIDYDDTVIDPGVNYRFCGPPGTIEVPDAGWPYDGRGNSVAFGNPVLGRRLYPFYVFNIDNGGAFTGEWFGTSINPTGGYAAFVDDSDPPVMDECTRFGLVRWGGEGENSCPLDVPAGACCFPDGSCLLLTEELCADQGGAYQGDDTLCSLTDCPGPTGACCFPDGTCQVLESEECGQMGGVYQGDATVCDPNPCPPPPSGACCFADAVCEMLTEAECVEAGGTYYGDEVPCDPNPCPPTATDHTTWGRVKATYR